MKPFLLFFPSGNKRLGSGRIAGRQDEDGMIRRQRSVEDADADLIADPGENVSAKIDAGGQAVDTARKLMMPGYVSAQIRLVMPASINPNLMR